MQFQWHRGGKAGWAGSAGSMEKEKAGYAVVLKPEQIYHKSTTSQLHLSSQLRAPNTQVRLETKLF